MAYNDEYIWSPYLNRRVLINGPEWAEHCRAEFAALHPEEADPNSPLRQYLRRQQEAARKGMSLPELARYEAQHKALDAGAAQWYKALHDAGGRFTESPEGTLIIETAAPSWPTAVRVPAIEIKAARVKDNPAMARFDGYLSTYSGVDSYGDRVDRHAFDRTLNERQGRPILWPVLYQHDQARPCGGITSAHSDIHGFRVEGLLDLDTDDGKAAWSGLSKGYLDSLSMGYKTVDSRHERDGTRTLLDVELLEASIVTLPANQGAKILTAHIIQE